MLAADLLASVFPDAAACLENIRGDRQLPDHPLVGQTVRDCLEEAMDLDGLNAVLGRIHRGEVTLVSRDTPEPSAQPSRFARVGVVVALVRRPDLWPAAVRVALRLAPTGWWRRRAEVRRLGKECHGGWRSRWSAST